MKKYYLLNAFILLLLLSCEPFRDINQNLQGEIDNMDFSFASGYADTNSIDTTLWSINLYRINPNNGFNPWEIGAYPENYPYITFTLAKASVPQEYIVTTFGISGKLITGWTTSSTGVSFDEGELTITKIDKVNNTIMGTIDAETFDVGSSLFGKFSIDINPASY